MGLEMVDFYRDVCAGGGKWSLGSYWNYYTYVSRFSVRCMLSPGI